MESDPAFRGLGNSAADIRRKTKTSYAPHPTFHLMKCREKKGNKAETSQGTGMVEHPEQLMIPLLQAKGMQHLTRQMAAS